MDGCGPLLKEMSKINPQSVFRWLWGNYETTEETHMLASQV